MRRRRTVIKENGPMDGTGVAYDMTRMQDTFRWEWYEFRMIIWLVCAALTIVVGITWILLS